MTGISRNIYQRLKGAVGDAQGSHCYECGKVFQVKWQEACAYNLAHEKDRCTPAADCAFKRCQRGIGAKNTEKLRKTKRRISCVLRSLYFSEVQDGVFFKQACD